jgi:two-component system, cell cycle response regulator
MEKLLRQIGYEVVVAVNGRDAMEKLLDRNGPRLALLDWMMPEMDGPRVCQRVRAATERPYVYVILLTSKNSRSDLVEGLDAGADDYLIKPCNPDELKARLRTGQRILRLEDNLVTARDEMRFKANHDALTLLWNRGKILEALDYAIENSDMFAILLCDVDHFKKINDVHGHLVGDAVLHEVAGRLRAAVRGDDAVGRYGGEEFLVLLNGCDARFLAERAEHLRIAVSGRSFELDGAELSLTVSIGAIAMNRNRGAMTAEDVLGRADAALYRAKEEGRNRIIVAELLAQAAAS